MTPKFKPAFFLKHLALLACLALPALSVRADAPAPAAAPGDAQGNITGRVVETINTAGYTYVQVDTGQDKIWAATTQFAVKNGDVVTLVGGMPMSNFHSKSLNRDFQMIYFTGRIVIATGGAGAGETAPVLPPGHPALPGQEQPALPPNHPSLTDQPGPTATVNMDGIKRAEGGMTVQDIVVGGATLAGQSVKVRGRIVKYNGMVMGKNWLHIQDGSGSIDQKDNDLTVTTATPAKLGDTVLVTGRVTTNKDFGAGYRYAVILEDAGVTVE